MSSTAWRAIGELVVICAISFAIAVAALFIWGETRHFGPDGYLKPLPWHKSAFLWGVIYFYGGLNYLVAQAFDLIPYGGWVIMFGALLVTVTIQNMLIWAIAKRVWRRRQRRA